MLSVVYKPAFIRQFNKLTTVLQDEICAKVDLLKNPKNHSILRVHKLHGALVGKWSFAVDYKHRIVFTYISKREVVLLVVGDHSVYE